MAAMIIIVPPRGIGLVHVGALHHTLGAVQSEKQELRLLLIW